MSMRALAVGLVVLTLAACGQKEEPACCDIPPQYRQKPPSSEPPAPLPPEIENFTLPPGADPALAVACASALSTRGLKPNELLFMARGPEAICPSKDVSEARIREILNKDWDAAGCKQFTKAEMLKALDSGACGGNAG